MSKHEATSIGEEWSAFKREEASGIAEFNGCNLERESCTLLGFAIEVNLPLLVRGIAIEVRVTRLFAYVRM